MVGGEGISAALALQNGLRFRRPSHRANARSPSPLSRGGMKQRKTHPMHKRDQVRRMRPRDWLAPPKDKRNDLARRARCDLLGSFRHCTDKRCRRARWCAGNDPRAWQGETLEIEIEIERGRHQDAAQRNRDTGRYYLLEAVMMP
jgi:hypothetical protein